jgi:hypothetical protein
MVGADYQSRQNAREYTPGLPAASRAKGMAPSFGPSPGRIG